ncbi:MAG TPA: PfkB family carbohydrate kinase [Candidatus Rubrimentiphilum sp.]|nr:PfkB family carbohydrate kinase [Candidatus Rubrimentiphilum sp.]
MQVMCIGGACVDRGYNVHGSVVFNSSNPAARGDAVFGGVARNVAENLARLGIQTSLLTVAGNDRSGQAMLNELKAAGVDVSLSKTIAGATDEYAAIMERGELVVGAADMRAIETLTTGDLDGRWESIAAAPWLFIECNVAEAVLRACADRRSIARYKLAVNAVSAPKSHRLPERLDAIDLLFINEGEAQSYLDDTGNTQEEELARLLMARGAPAVVLSSAERGIICAQGGSFIRVPAAQARRVSATGAGDALIAGTLRGLIAGQDLPEAVRTGANLAALTLESERSVRPDLSPALLDAR